MRAVSGMIYQYFFICKRKMWYYSHGITMEEENENVQIGKIIDETSYNREQKHILIDDYANIDFMKDNTLFEIKKSSKHNESAIAQIKYYLYILHNKEVKDIEGELRIPKENKIEKVYLTEEDILIIEKNLEKINIILNKEVPPEVEEMKICKNCAYFELCYI